MLDRIMLPLKPHTVGVDISDQAVRLVSLRRHDGKLYLKHACQALLPSGAVVDCVVKQPEIVGVALQTLMKRHRLGKAKVVIAAAERHTQTHMLSLQGATRSLDPLALEQEVLAELDAHIGHAIEDFYIDFQTVASDRRSADGLAVEVKCVPKSLYDNTLSALRQAHMVPQIMDIAPLALQYNPWQDIEVDANSVLEGCENDYALSAALAMRGV